MGMVFSKEKDQRRRIEGLGACSLRWSQLEQAYWLVLTDFGRSRQQQLDQQCLHCSVFTSLLFMAPLNKLLNRVLWVLTSDSRISSTLRDYRPSSLSVVTAAESKA